MGVGSGGGVGLVGGQGGCDRRIEVFVKIQKKKFGGGAGVGGGGGGGLGSGGGGGWGRGGGGVRLGGVRVDVNEELKFL